MSDNFVYMVDDPQSMTKEKVYEIFSTRIGTHCKRTGIAFVDDVECIHEFYKVLLPVTMMTETALVLICKKDKIPYWVESLLCLRRNEASGRVSRWFREVY